MALFDSASMAAIDAVAAKSKQKLATKPAISNSTVDKIAAMEETVREYFKDSEAILITSKEQLHEYIDGCIDAGYAGIDTETTGLDKVSDTIVGSSLYYPGGVECYIPNFHKVPIMENYRSNQLSYAECQEEFQRLVDNKVKCIFANADYDIAMLYKDYKVDFIPACYYDVILAWRVIKENEPHNGLKQLYSKYVLKGEGDPKKFSDFFDAKTFPYCKPDVAKLYAANDARITYELFLWQLPYVTKTNPKCISHHLEHIADIVWGIEIPMIKACAELHRTGMYIEKDVASYITKRYNEYYEKELATMRDMVQKLIDEMDIPNNSARPFKTGADFNPDSVVHTKYLLYTLMQVPVPTVGKNKGKKPTGKEVVGEINMPEAKQLLKVRSLSTLIGTFTEKLPNSVASDNRIHASFKSIGAATGRMSSQSPNLQNIPSKHTDIRHMFRATPEMETDGECTIEGTMLRIELNLLSVVYLESGEEKQVKNLVCGDLVEIRLGNKTNAPIRYFPVKSKVINEPNAYVYIGADEVSSDIHYVLRHRTPPYVLIGSDYSQQEPKILGFVAKDPAMIKAFSEGKDIYSTIASIAFNVPYEECLENHPVTGEYQKEGKARRTQAKSIVLGVSYGRSIPSIAEQLFGSDDTMSDDEKTKEAQKVYDSVMAAFPNLRQLMISAQATAKQKGYVETILGRRRHIPDMMLPPFAFEPMAGYVNPDIDPLDPSTLHNKEVIPARIVDALTKEYASFKYNGQRYRRNNELYEEHIKVIDNRSKINDASRECVNSIIQGSASELTKMAIISLINNKDWQRFGGRFLVPVHDELIAEVPAEYAEEAGKVLTDCMVNAGSFLPFAINCDLEITYRWYGLSVNSIAYKHQKPESLDNMSEDNIKWVQAHICEMEYVLPLFNDENGEKPRGDAAHGVNGIWTQELSDSIDDYCVRFNIPKSDFISDIQQRVERGYVKPKLPSNHNKN